MDRCHKVESNAKQHIIVKFASYRDKHSVMRNRRMLKGSGITISENLTKARVTLLKSAQETFGREHVWTMDGVVWVKHMNRKYRITHEAELLEMPK